MAKIPIILEAGRADGKLATSNAIFDENKGMFQSEINDIQDTLNSDNPNKPLSAKQGKVLKELLDAKVIEVGAVPVDTEPIEGNTTHVVNSDGLAKEFNKCNTAIITTDRIEDGAVTTEKIATSAFDNTLSVSGKIAPADVVGRKLTELDGQLNGKSNCENLTYTFGDFQHLTSVDRFLPASSSLVPSIGDGCLVLTNSSSESIKCDVSNYFPITQTHKYAIVNKYGGAGTYSVHLGRYTDAGVLRGYAYGTQTQRQGLHCDVVTFSDANTTQGRIVLDVGNNRAASCSWVAIFDLGDSNSPTYNYTSEKVIEESSKSTLYPKWLISTGGLANEIEAINKNISHLETQSSDLQYGLNNLTESVNKKEENLNKKINEKISGVTIKIDNLVKDANNFASIVWNVSVGTISDDKKSIIAHSTYKQIYATYQQDISSGADKFIWTIKYKGNPDISNELHVQFFNNGENVGQYSKSLPIIETIDGWKQGFIIVPITGIATSLKLSLNIKSTTDILELSMPIICEATDENIANLEIAKYYEDYVSNDMAKAALFSRESSSLTDTAVKSILDNNTPQTNKEYFSKLRICCLGDSYTNMGFDEYTTGFIFNALKDLGINVDRTYAGNFGVGGCWLSIGASGRSDSMVERYTQIPDCDILTIMGGMNEGMAPYNSWEEKIGTKESTSTNTFWGALKTIIEGWQTIHPYNNTSIILMTYPSHLNYDNKKRINQAIRECSYLYGLPLVDFERNCGFVGHLQSEQNRTNFAEGITFSEGYLIINDGKTIVPQSTNKYCADYIEIPADAKYLWGSSNNVIYYYDNSKNYLGYSNYGGGAIPENTKYIRMGGTKNAVIQVWVMDSQYISDGVHPNMLGFARMSPILSAKLKEIFYKNYLSNHRNA